MRLLRLAAAVVLLSLPGRSGAIVIETSVSGLTNAGNSRYQDYGGSFLVTDGDPAQVYNELKAGFLNRRLSEPTGIRYEENYTASYHHQITLYWDWLLMALRGSWERKRYAGLDRRIELRPGLGTSWKWGERDMSPGRARWNDGHVRLLLGPHLLGENYVDDSDSLLQAGQYAELSGQQAWTLLGRAWSLAADYTYSSEHVQFEDGATGRIELHRASGGLGLAWTSSLSSELKYSWEQRRDAIEGFKRADTQAALSLTYRFDSAK